MNYFFKQHIIIGLWFINAVFAQFNLIEKNEDKTTFQFTQENISFETFMEQTYAYLSFCYEKLSSCYKQQVSYSLPKPKYNIIDFKLKYNFDDNTINTEKEIVIPDGYYDINSLLDVLNNNEDIEFSVGNNQKIKMSIKIPKNDDPSAIIVNKNFKLLINKTSKQLGFINQNDEFLLNLQADKLWDLRLPTKVYMYILNLQKESPFGILNFNGTSTCELTFNNPISLSNLNILFVTENNKNYNFNDLNYNLSFQINVLENNPYFNFVSNIQ